MVVGRALAVCALQGAWDAEELWHPPAPAWRYPAEKRLPLSRATALLSCLVSFSPYLSVELLSESQSCWEGEIPSHLSWAFRFLEPSVSPQPWALLQVS